MRGLYDVKVKVNLFLCFWLSIMPWRHIGGVDVLLYTFLTSALVVGEWSASGPGHRLNEIILKN